MIAFKELILHEDDDLYVINKPAGISCLAEHDTATTCLFDLMKAYNPDARLCHRLDKHTTGCMIVSKNDNCYRHIAMAFEHRKIQKTYHAIAHNPSGFNQEKIELALVKKGNNTGIVAKTGKEATTIITTAKCYKHFSLIACQPITGRFHQIRLHLSHIGHPLVADELYGGELPYLSQVKSRYKSSKREENPMINRYVLHAYQLKFTSINNNDIEIAAPYPKDFQTLLKLLDKNDQLNSAY